MGSSVAKHEAAALQAMATPEGVQGIDVSHWQGTVDWAGWASQGIKFAVMKATEGVSYIDSKLDANYTGSAGAGLIRGAYHFALPNESTGTVQANFFLA